MEDRTKMTLSDVNKGNILSRSMIMVAGKHTVVCQMRTSLTFHLIIWWHLKIQYQEHIQNKASISCTTMTCLIDIFVNSCTMLKRNHLEEDFIGCIKSSYGAVYRLEKNNSRIMQLKLFFLIFSCFNYYYFVLNIDIK